MNFNIKNKRIATVFALSFALIMIFSASGAIFTPVAAGANMHSQSGNNIKSVNYFKSAYMQIPYAAGSVSKAASRAYNGKISVMVSLRISHQSQLNSLLYNISDKSSPQYHKYLNRSEFTAMFSPSSCFYQNMTDYFYSFPDTKVTTFPDRISLIVTAPASVIGHIFNTTIATSTGNPHIYYADSTPELPALLGNNVVQVSGLTNHAMVVSNNMVIMAPLSGAIHTVTTQNGYPAPINNSGNQYIYGSDLQVAYDEQSLLNVTYPTNQVIATILWSGTNSSGKNVGPFNPSDINAYFNATLPSYEPHPKIYGVPVNGAPQPGISATYDATGANYENTLDLEMAGSTAPGASIYNVYGPNATSESIDAAFAYILNPNASFSQLNNVSVITNSWGAPEYNDTTWYTYLQEAQARGITVLASSGDSGDNAQSKKYVANPSYPNDFVQFPSAMAYDNFGVTAVGGDTLTLNSNLQIHNETAWYISASDSAAGGPAGSTGGISQVFPEPSWQKNTEANNVIGGSGRGVPDISAIANNTIIYITTNGGSLSVISIGGTSVASPAVAGIIAEMDAVLKHYNESNLGYLNPMIYKIANSQITSQTSTSTTGYINTGSYNSTLPLTALYDVKYGRNHLDYASFGYDLVTGWGSIDAYNLTMYLLSVNYSGKNYALGGVENILNLSGLKVTSYLYNTSTKNFTTVNTLFNASIQQNFFVADALGAPIYWIQNVIYINGSQQSGWTMNYSGWVIYPFYGLYPNEAVYEYNYPLGKIVSLPHEFNIKTWLSNVNSLGGQTMNFEVNSHTLTIPVPGASFIIGSHNYSYSWQGKTYSNGPYPNNPYPGGLDPQFGLIGGPSGGLGHFFSPTAGNLSANLLPLGAKNYIPASTGAYNLSIDQTGEMSENLNWVKESSGLWNLSVQNGSTLQGVVSYVPFFSNATFTESGLPSGTPWYVNLSNGMKSGAITGSSYSFSLTNGTYSYTISTTDKTYRSSSSTGSLTVSGSPVSVPITFSKVNYTVNFTETGLSSGTPWYVNLSNGMTSGPITGSSYSFSLTNGTYTYTIGKVSEYSTSASSGTFTVNGAPLSFPITFSKVYFSATFTESGLPSGTTWYVNLSNGITSGAITASTYAFSLVNGTYSYNIATTDKSYGPSPPAGNFTVKGSAITKDIKFSSFTYTASFSESGLPTGTTWYVNLSNGLKSSGTSASFSFSLVNGSYSYTVSTSNKLYAPSSHSGTILVNESNPVVAVNFSIVDYTATFTESGLPSNTTWYVNLSNGMTSGPITGSSYTFSLPNGTYTYTIATTDRIYNSSPGSILVNGNSVAQPITFTKVTYKATFTETGLPSGTTWYVNLSNGMTSGPITGSSYTFSLPNGTYSYATSNTPGYSVLNSSGSIMINGKNASIIVTFSTANKSVPSSGISRYQLLIMIGGATAAVAIASALIIMRKRK